MSGLNDCNFIGNLGRDPEVRYSQAGVAVCHLSLACNERVKKGDQWVDHVEWIRLTVFGKSAESAGQYLSKGSRVFAKGRFRSRKYTDRDGVERYSSEFVCSQVLFLSSKDGAQPPKAKEQGAQVSEDPSGFYDDDLPF